MDGLKINDTTLFMGKIPCRKQECFYFVDKTGMYPVAYINEKNIKEARRLWDKMLSPLKEL